MSQAGRLEETGSGNTSVNEIDADVGVALPIAGVINISVGKLKTRRFHSLRYSGVI